MKPASQITDRAKRYRANRTPPPGPRRCNFCGSRKNVDVDHISGNESDDEPDNLMYLCRPCNAAKAVQQARNRIGIRTRQYNPAPRTVAGWKRAVRVLLGLEPGDVAQATNYVRRMKPEQRAKFASNPAAPTFGQYAHAVSTHRRKSHDASGKVIHATPKALRSRYAQRIAAIKAERRRQA